MRHPLLIALAALITAPAAVAAQGLSLAGRAGTTGLGGEVILSLAPKLALRGGVGAIPFDIDVEMGRRAACQCQAAR